MIKFDYQTQLMALWSQASQCHEMFYHDSEVMGSNPSQVQSGSAYSVCLSWTSQR